MMSLTGIRGFSDPNGSWKMICIRLRNGRIPLGSRPVMSSPPKTTLPPVGGSSWSTVRPRVVLPQPDSPTRLKISPFLTSKSTPSTAYTVPTRRRRMPP